MKHHLTLAALIERQRRALQLARVSAAVAAAGLVLTLFPYTTLFRSRKSVV